MSLVFLDRYSVVYNVKGMLLVVGGLRAALSARSPCHSWVQGQSISAAVQTRVLAAWDYACGLQVWRIFLAWEGLWHQSDLDRMSFYFVQMNEANCWQALNHWFWFSKGQSPLILDRIKKEVDKEQRNWAFNWTVCICFLLCTGRLLSTAMHWSLFSVCCHSNSHNRG